MKTLLLFLLCIYFTINLAFSQNVPNNATREETIEWILNKVSHYSPHVSVEYHADNGITVTSTKKIEGSVILSSSIHKLNEYKFDTFYTSFDLNKFYDYSFRIPDKETKSFNPSITYLLYIKCNGCGKIWGGYYLSGEILDEFYIELIIDEKMKARFIKALEHLKALSKNNKEKF